MKDLFGTLRFWEQLGIEKVYTDGLLFEKGSHLWHGRIPGGG